VSIVGEEIFNLLGVKQGMTDDRYFVGREELLSSISCCASGEQRTPVWIYGPRRIGKTSIANAVSRKAKKENTTVIYLDTSDLPSDSIEGVLERSVSRVKRQFHVDPGDIKQQFESIAEKSVEKPILFIFDEFDKIATNMLMDDQAFLRRLDAENKKFSYLFISCVPTENIVENFPDINSRLLGVCNKQKIAPLERRDIKRLFKKVAADLEMPDFKHLDKIVWKMVCGFPVAVMSMTKALAIAWYHRGELDEEKVFETLRSARRDVTVDIEKYWHSLQSATRAVMLGRCEPDKYQQVLKEDGFYNRREGFIKPQFLVEAAENSAPDINLSTSDDKSKQYYENIFNLGKLISRINHSLQLKSQTHGFYLGNQTIKMYKLSRNPCDENNFKASVDYLYKIFYEGARVKKKNKIYRLPSPLDFMYKSNPVIGTISKLRNFIYHDKTRNTDAEKQNKYFSEAGDVFEKYCGQRDPFNDILRQQIRQGLINDLLSLLNEIYNKLIMLDFDSNDE